MGKLRLDRAEPVLDFDLLAPAFVKFEDRLGRGVTNARRRFRPQELDERVHGEERTGRDDLNHSGQPRLLRLGEGIPEGWIREAPIGGPKAEASQAGSVLDARSAEEGGEEGAIVAGRANPCHDLPVPASTCHPRVAAELCPGASGDDHDREPCFFRVE